MTLDVRSVHVATLACVGLFVVLASPVGRQALEASLSTHMLVQMPLLGLVGYAVGTLSADAARGYVAGWNRDGATGLLLAVVISMFWMLPRAMDSALVDTRFELAKFVSIPIAGVALGWSYGQAYPIVKGVLVSHAVSALGVMGWVYASAPVRLCNSYLASDQEAAGVGLLAIGLVVSIYFAAHILAGPFRVNATLGDDPCSLASQDLRRE